MIQKSFGNIHIVITDSIFGDVIPGDESFLKQYNDMSGNASEKLAWMNQVHSPHLERVSKEDSADVLFPETDGLITQEPGRLLITKTADCIPILLWNTEAQAIAALHCGWRGFFRGIIESFSEEVRKNGWRLEEFSAFLGPHLRVRDFQVQKDFIDQIPEDKRLYLNHSNDEWTYNMTLGVTETLQKTGIKEVQDSGINTYNNPDYFSYRSWCHLPEERRPEKYSTFANTIVISDTYVEKT